MSSAEIKASQDLHRTLVAFFDELIEMFSEEGQFVALRIMIKDQIPVTAIRRHFVKNLIPEKEVIRTRDKGFFDRNVLFSQLGQAQCDNFRRLFLGLDQENQNAIWKWLDAFVVLTEKCAAFE